MTDRLRTATPPTQAHEAPATVDLPSGSPQPDIAPVIRSKIQPPALRSTTLTRQRLIDRLHEATASRVTLVVAEAGYGKTTLLADFAARSGQRTLWYRLDPTDADAITWTNYLVAAGREIVPEFGRSTSALLSQVASGGPPNSVLAASVIGELQELGAAPTVLVLDDFHAVEASPEACEFVERLVRDAPAWMHIVIASRRRPGLRLGRLEAMGELAQMGTDDLRFSLSETEHLFADRLGTPLDADVLRDVDGRAKGWVASLQLFHGSIRGKPASAVRALARSISGGQSPLYDFLAEEVLTNVPAEIDEFLVRASVLDRVVAGHVVALFGDLQKVPTAVTALSWIDHADRLGLLSRTSQASDARQLHPLLREFLLKRLRQRNAPQEVAAMHLRLARAVESSDPLTASVHYLEAGEDLEAMRCLGSSVMLTMGSGQWGAASDLIDRLKGVPADPAVAAIQARRHIEEGDLERAGRLLSGVDVSPSPPEVRAVFRHAKLSLGWTTGDRDLLLATLTEIQGDSETPPILGDIFQMFVDASSLAPTPSTYGALARRLERMAMVQSKAGHSYYAAISRHNASLMSLAAGRFDEAQALANEALDTFDLIPGVDNERFSTHAVLTMCSFEMGDSAGGEEHLRTALSSGAERGDVHADIAYALAMIGDFTRASQLLLSSMDLRREGRSDVTGDIVSGFARALMTVSREPDGAASILASLPRGLPLETGYDLDRQTLAALALLLGSELEPSVEAAVTARDYARVKGSRRSEARLSLIAAMGRQDPPALRDALVSAESVGELAILTVADALGRFLWLVPEGPKPLRTSVAHWPSRWLPILRRQLEAGGTANGFAAASLLDEFGELADVGRLRAFVKTYRRGLRGASGLGRALARRVAARLQIDDLGRTVLRIGDRVVGLSEMRKKSAALLMFLVTRPGHSATREQVLEELWPESDPEGAANNLNQSLYFLRRDIDPWFEDDISVDYVLFQGDVVWLEPALLSIASAEFVADVRAAMSTSDLGSRAIGILARYAGQFCPEFEYEEWAMGWRNRIHALYLQFANAVISQHADAGRLADAREAALIALGQDPVAREIEQKLVWLYWHLGARSSALAQFEHLTGQERADGVDASSFGDLTGERLP